MEYHWVNRFKAANSTGKERVIVTMRKHGCSEALEADIEDDIDVQSGKAKFSYISNGSGVSRPRGSRGKRGRLEVNPARCKTVSTGQRPWSICSRRRRVRMERCS